MPARHACRLESKRCSSTALSTSVVSTGKQGLQYLVGGVLLIGGSAYIYSTQLRDGQRLPMGMKHHYAQAKEKLYAGDLRSASDLAKKAIFTAEAAYSKG